MQSIKSLILKRKKGEETFSNFTHVSVHYVQRKDAVESLPRLYYVVNNKIKRAFWAPRYIQVLTERNIIRCLTYNKYIGLLKYLKDNQIELIMRYPIGNELGLLEDSEITCDEKQWALDDDRRRYRKVIRNEIVNLLNEVEIQKEYPLPQHIIPKEWTNESPERRPFFFSLKEYFLIQDFYSKLDYWNQIIDKWGFQMQQEHREFWTLLRDHCIDSGNLALRDIQF